MFAPVGRRDYDETRIRGSESLLHVAGARRRGVHWRDNQSGCKGVCEGLPRDEVNQLAGRPACAPATAAWTKACWACPAWKTAWRPRAAQAGTQLLVLHMLGNHGPSYYRRYPAAFERFKPACQSDDLRRCSREEIVNAYDNALLYTDHVLATLLRAAGASADRVDSAMLYVSDHGESLGENNLFLHGVPYAIAPSATAQGADGDVGPARASPGHRRGARPACSAGARSRPQHDHLFHTLLGLLDVQTALLRDRPST
jgi:lipid A ethanolaminephosphotransferase